MDPQKTADERLRRKSMAQVMLGLEQDFEPEYLGDEDLDPVNLPEPADDEEGDKLAMYYQVAQMGGAAQPGVDAPQEEAQPANAQGDQSQLLMARILQRMEDRDDKRKGERRVISQKDATSMLEAVPSVAPDGIVLMGAQLLAWFEELTTTYIPDEPLLDVSVCVQLHLQVVH
jgi:hypothetical protein